jgi:hypothetical protein
MENANELLGFLHGAYGLGATISPLSATSMITKGGLPVSMLMRTEHHSFHFFDLKMKEGDKLCAHQAISTHNRHPVPRAQGIVAMQMTDF